MRARAKPSRSWARWPCRLPGYGDSGECLHGHRPERSVALRNTRGPGTDDKGAVWGAARIPAGHVGVSANRPRLPVMNFDDKDNFMVSPIATKVAEKMGWWKQGEPFNMGRIFGGTPRGYGGTASAGVACAEHIRSVVAPRPVEPGSALHREGREEGHQGRPDRVAPRFVRGHRVRCHRWRGCGPIRKPEPRRRRPGSGRLCRFRAHHLGHRLLLRRGSRSAQRHAAVDAIGRLVHPGRCEDGRLRAVLRRQHRGAEGVPRSATAPSSIARPRGRRSTSSATGHNCASTGSCRTSRPSAPS